MKITKVGTTFLDSHSINQQKQYKNKKSQHHVHNHSQDRKPLVTPVLLNGINKNNDNDGNDGNDGQQYILIPNKDHILVMSMEHGQKVCTLVPSEGKGDNDNTKNAIIQSVTIVKQKQFTNGDDEMNNDEVWVVMAGLSNGTLHEWNLSSIPLCKGKNSSIQSNRIFRLPAQTFGNSTEIANITSPVGSGETGLLYALVKNNTKSGDKRQCCFVRIIVPFVENKEDDDNDSETSIYGLEDYTLLATFSKQSAPQNEMIGNDSIDEKLEPQRFSSQTFPFALMSISCEEKGKLLNYVAMVDNQILIIYYENTFNCHARPICDRFVSYNQHVVKNSICAAAMAPNGEDIALGFNDGKIDILVSILSQTSSYIDDLSPTKTHPSQNVLKRAFHWHSLPVKTLCYLGFRGSRAAPSLLSGGEEAVLVTWNTERGLNKPTYTLPRIAKGCITHIATSMYPNSASSTSNGMDIVVRCMDNTLQLIQGHNHATVWKVQGLATANNECVDEVRPEGASKIPSAILQIDPTTQTPVMTRLPGAPGFIHWYDINANQVVGELEVAPYNRISRKESHHHAYPRPIVTNFVISNSGNDLITVDTMLTENTSLGKELKVNSFVKGGDDLSEKMSLVTNIKFWAWSREMEKKRSNNPTNKEMPYEMISAMPNPHGSVHGEIHCLAISPSGSRGCSVSFEQGVFQIWGKGKTMNSDKNSLSPILPLWKRLCKITIPSGYSTANHRGLGQDKNSLVNFSSDGSVLAIAFGKNISLWDHTNATLLNTVRAPDHLHDIQFVRSPLDMMLTVGKSSVSIQAPFGEGYLGCDSWSYKLPETKMFENKKIELGLVTPLTLRKELAVAIKETEEKGKSIITSTKIVLIDIMTGEAKKTKNGLSSYLWNINGKVESMCDISQAQANGVSQDATLLVLTDSNEIYVLDANGDTPTEHAIDRGCFSPVRYLKSQSALTSTNAPKLQIGNKRKSKTVELNAMDSSRNDDEELVGKGSLVFDSSESVSLLTSQLPALTDTFTQAFLARKFKKTKHID